MVIEDGNVRCLCQKADRCGLFGLWQLHMSRVRGNER